MKLRLPFSLLLALLVSAVLFWLMHRLIVLGGETPTDNQTTQPLDRVRIVAEPPPPPPPPPPQRQPPPVIAPQPRLTATANSIRRTPTMPARRAAVAVNLDIAGRMQTGESLVGVAGSGATAAFGDGAEGFAGDDLIPIASARPKYPRSAAARKIEGWVELIFIVNGDGRVENVRVLDASPRGIFEDAAVHAMRRWLYRPLYRGGQPVIREATQLIEFRLEDIQPLYLWDD